MYIIYVLYFLNPLFTRTSLRSSFRLRLANVGKPKSLLSFGSSASSRNPSGGIRLTEALWMRSYVCENDMQKHTAHGQILH